MTEQLNKLEKKFLELIQYNVTVKSSLYAKYYFELRALFKDNEKEFPLVPIDRSEEMKLEIDMFGYREESLRVEVEPRLMSTFGGITSKPFLMQPTWEWEQESHQSWALIFAAWKLKVNIDRIFAAYARLYFCNSI